MKFVNENRRTLNRLLTFTKRANKKCDCKTHTSKLRPHCEKRVLRTHFWTFRGPSYTTQSSLLWFAQCSGRGSRTLLQQKDYNLQIQKGARQTVRRAVGHPVGCILMPISFLVGLNGGAPLRHRLLGGHVLTS